MKGVSPVVATVLLIAIAVISAVAVWFWVSPLTTAASVPETATKAYTVTDVYTNSSNNGCNAIDLKNTGSITLTNIIFEVRDYVTGRTVGKSGTDSAIPAYINVSTLSPGTIVLFNISSIGNATNMTSVQFGTYTIKPTTASSSVTGIAAQIFSCPGA